MPIVKAFKCRGAINILFARDVPEALEVSDVWSSRIFNAGCRHLDSPYSPEKDKRRYEQTRRVVQVVISKQLYELVS